METSRALLQMKHGTMEYGTVDEAGASPRFGRRPRLPRLAALGLMVAGAAGVLLLVGGHARGDAQLRLATAFHQTLAAHSVRCSGLEFGTPNSL
eukprot:SAG31_NODE_111_length_24443_cov_231.743685_9_plen_94_part_00